MANKAELIRQALSSAESSIKLAKQLMSELERSGNSSHTHSNSPQHRAPEKKEGTENIPGIMGVFDGEQMVTQAGEKLAVPANYAAKSQIVVGDTLKQIDQNGEKRFKQIQRVKRLRTTGILTKKEGKLTVVAQEGRFRVLTAAVEHVGATVGDELAILVPEGNLNSGWAAIAGEETAVSRPTEAVRTSPTSEKASHASKPEIEKAVPAEVVSVGSDESDEKAASVESPDDRGSDAGVVEGGVSEAPAVPEPAVSEPLVAPAEKPKSKATESSVAPVEPVVDAKPAKGESSALTPEAGESVLLTDEDLR